MMYCFFVFLTCVLVPRRADERVPERELARADQGRGASHRRGSQLGSGQLCQDTHEAGAVRRDLPRDLGTSAV